MKFLGDMGISPRSTDFLQTLGYDAEHLLGQGLERLPDSEIMEQGVVVSVTEARIRVRDLPISKSQ